jgi:hypothetical protein
MPAEQLGVPLATEHPYMHEPQCMTVLMSVSHPFDGSPSQSPKPDGH